MVGVIESEVRPFGNNGVCPPVEKLPKSCFVLSTMMRMLEKFPPVDYNISHESIILENNYRIY